MTIEQLTAELQNPDEKAREIGGPEPGPMPKMHELLDQARQLAAGTKPSPSSD